VASAPLTDVLGGLARRRDRRVDGAEA
jgi:hypothetical protein